MTLINQVFAESGVSLTTLYNPAPKIPLTSKITDLLSLNHFNLINFIFILIGLAFFANLIMAGWDFMLSSGDPKKVAVATTRILNGLVGLVMAVLAFVVVRLITNILGLGNLV